MDWTNIIITALTLLISSGGLVTIVTLREKKNAAFLENVSKLIDQWQEIAEERKNRVAELKTELDRKDEKIDALYMDNGKFRDGNNALTTENAVLRLQKCEKNGCNERKPPRGY